jgi:CelD/BcsL family acetyltransferase involved in cellulose biosynthesis
MFPARTPLAEPGFERMVAGVIGHVLDGLKVDRVVLDLVDPAWCRRLFDCWPSARPFRADRKHDSAVPVLHLAAGTYEAWFESKSRNFRSQMRRAQRGLTAAGGALRLSTRQTVDDDLLAFHALHHARWSHRGGSAVLTPELERTLAEAADAMLDDGRFRLWCIDIGSRTISAQLFIAGGGAVAYWLGGFDDAYAHLHPNLVGFLAAIEQAFETGDRRLSFGAGDQHYKTRFADDLEDLESWTIRPRSRRDLVRGARSKLRSFRS